MKSTLISKEGSKIKFEVVFSSEEFEAACDKAYKKNRSQFTIDGFRKGKAPRKMIENYYGADIFYNDALNDLFDKGYYDAIDELELEPIDQPQVMVPEINKGEDIVITVNVEGFPEVEVKNYKGLEIEKAETVIGDKEVDEEIERVRKGQARMETVTDRVAKEGDTVIIDFKGSIDGVAFEGGSGENFELKLGSGQFIPGFEDQLVGKEAESEVEVNVTFPEDYHADDLAGKPALFETKIHEIKEEILPEVDDDFASDVSDFETLDEYKADLKVKLQEAAKDRDASVMKDRALEALHNQNEIETPEVMVQNELDNMIYDIQQQFAYQGIKIEDYLNWTGKSIEDLKNDSREEAVRRINTRILLKNIIRIENIDATEEEVDKEIETFAAQYGQTAEQVKEAVGAANLKYFKEDVLTKKAIEMIYAEAVQK